MKRFAVLFSLLALVAINISGQTAMSMIRVKNQSAFAASVLFITSDAATAVLIGEVVQGAQTDYSPLIGSESLPYILYEGATRSSLVPIKTLVIQPGYYYELQIVDGTFPAVTDYKLVVIGKYK